jgi:hypothetical protein
MGKRFGCVVGPVYMIFIVYAANRQEQLASL